VRVSDAISGLTTGRTYHFRLVAMNTAGTANGSDLTFSTAMAPTAVTGAATAGERQVGAASPTLAQAVAGSVAGLAGVVPAAVAGWLAAGSLSRLRRGALTAALGVAVAAVVVPKLF